MSRIIAGSARGVRLTTLDGSLTRPTTDRVREALFSAIAGWAGTAGEPVTEQCSGLRVVDLFGGSGALGLEAASRGADTVVWVERDRNAAGVITKNMKATKLAGRVVRDTVQRYLSQPSSVAFDLIMADPPYGLSNSEIESMAELICANHFLADDGLLVVERSIRDGEPAWPAGLSCYRQRRYGETCLYFCEPAKDNDDV